jgi:DNA polymerase III subunit chi
VPDIAFHTGLADKATYTCRLLRKAWRQGARVAVTGAPDLLNRLDQLLWTFEPDEFIPHARLRGGATPDPALARTPIWLLDDPAAGPEAAVLVNLGPGMATGVERFARVIEIVGEAADDAQAGRQRWRRYLAAGFKPALHESTGVSRGPSA